MSNGINNTPVSIPGFLTTQRQPAGGATQPVDPQGSFAIDLFTPSQPAATAPAGGADPASALQDPNPAVRFQAVIDITKMPPAQAIPLLQQAAGSNDNPQVRELAGRALSVMQQMPGAQPGMQPQPGAQPQPGTQPQPFQLPFQGQQPQPQQNFQQPVQQQQPAFQGPTFQADPNATVDGVMAMIRMESNPGIAANSIMQLEQFAQSDKQAVFSVLVNEIDPRQHWPNPQRAVAAIQVMSDTNMKEAMPYLRYLIAQPYLDQSIYTAANACIQKLGGGGTPGQPGTASVNQGDAQARIAAFESKLQNSVAEGDRLAAIQGIEQLAGSDRQDAVNALLRVIDVRTSHVQPTIMSAAIQSLVNLHAAEATPFLKYLVAQPYLDRTLMQNAINALTQLKNATPGVPGQTR